VLWAGVAGVAVATVAAVVAVAETVVAETAIAETAIAETGVAETAELATATVWCFHCRRARKQCQSAALPRGKRGAKWLGTLSQPSE
jgi:hypothetical protein